MLGPCDRLSEPYTACGGHSIHRWACHQGNTTHSPSTQCRPAGRQGARTWPTGEGGDRAELQGCQLCFLKHDETRGWPEAMEELSRGPGDETPCEWGLEPPEDAPGWIRSLFSICAPRLDRMNPESEAAGTHGEAFPRQGQPLWVPTRSPQDRKAMLSNKGW